MSTTLPEQPPTSEDSRNFAVPSELDSIQSKLVYLFLRVEGKATINELNDSLGMQKLSLYPTLGTLVEQDFIQQDGETYAFQNT